MLAVGMIVENRYRILREIGRGGTSCVYLAENIRLHNYWAIKEVYRNGVAGRDEDANTLIAESNILTKLHHPGLPSIIDIVDTPDSFLIVMEYIEGVSLDKALNKQGAQSQENVLKWGQQICDVLSYLHSQLPPIIYRDMKPANIMLKPDGNVVLIDFGMARVFKKTRRHDTAMLGTHGYAAPEQYSDSRQSDARTDVYSLGVTLYHLVTGRDPCLPPYGITSITSVNPALSPQLDQIIQKCTQLEPEMRFQSAGEMGDALRAVYQTGGKNPGSNQSQNKGGKGALWFLALIPVLIIVISIALTQNTGNVSAGGGTGNWMSDPFAIATPVPTATPVQEPTMDPAVYYGWEISIGDASSPVRVAFEAKSTGYYKIYSDGENLAPYAFLYDSDNNILAYDNIDGAASGFEINVYLQRGRIYYIETSLSTENPAYKIYGLYWVYVNAPD